jgi:hypothetical protein
VVYTDETRTRGHHVSPATITLTPNVYIPQETLYNQAKQLHRMVFPGSKERLHTWDSCSVLTLRLSAYDTLYHSWWQMCTRNLKQDTDSNFFSHETGLPKLCYHWWSVMGSHLVCHCVHKPRYSIITGYTSGRRKWWFVFVTILHFQWFFLTV